MDFIKNLKQQINYVAFSQVGISLLLAAYLMVRKISSESSQGGKTKKNDIPY